MPKGLVVSAVEENSIGAELEIESGDIVLQINDQEINDIIDFQYFSADEIFTMYIQKKDKEIWQLDIEKYPGESLGIDICTVSSEGLKKCTNNCVFCFVRQMPPGMRESLYDRDDDYRLSFTQGSYITLSNLSEHEFEKIIAYHISPLYVSVHAWDTEIRRQMMKNPKAGKLPDQIRRLVDAGITIHTQVVLVPGYNDGDVLTETVEKLACFYPQVQSIGIVPVGLTKYRDGLPNLETITADEAEYIITKGSQWQEHYREKCGKSLVYLSDEFYLLAGKEFPDVQLYDDFPQLENGIGMTSLFLQDLAALLPYLPQTITPRRVHIVTGVLAAIIFKQIAQELKIIKGLEIEVHEIENNFFGRTVTVAGLLTAQDIAEQLVTINGDIFLIPEVMLKADQDIFLDNLDVAWLEKKVEGKAVIVENNAQSFLEELLGINLEVAHK